MKRIPQQTGASLVMIIVVTAILITLAASMVALVTNAQSSRNRDRHRAQTFNVAEAALDDGLARVAANWPDEPWKSLAWGTVQENEFKDSYASAANGLQAQYPTLRVKEWFYDNSNKPLPVDNVIDSTDYTYDANGDGMMYVEVQAQDGNRSSRIRALVQRQMRSPGIPRGVPWYNYNHLKAHGGSTVFAVDVDFPPPADVAVKAYVGRAVLDGDPNGDYTVDGSNSPAANVTVYVGGVAWDGDGMNKPLADMTNVLIHQPVPPLSSIIYPDFITELKRLAMSAKPTNYYDDASKISAIDANNGATPTSANDPNSIPWQNTALNDLSGIVWVDATSLPKKTYSVQLKKQWNSPLHPGILAVDGNLSWYGNESANYYGLIYATGSVTGLGNMKVHGIIISASGSCDLGGIQSVSYNDEVWRNLFRLLTASSRIVPNTWREVPPLPGVF